MSPQLERHSPNGLVGFVNSKVGMQYDTSHQAQTNTRQQPNYASNRVVGLPVLVSVFLLVGVNHIKSPEAAEKTSPCDHTVQLWATHNHGEL